MQSEGNETTQVALMSNGIAVPKRTCRRLTFAEWNSSSEANKRKMFDGCIRAKLGVHYNMQ